MNPNKILRFEHGLYRTILEKLHRSSGFIRFSDVEDLTELTCIAMGIREAVEIDNCRNLNKLNLSFNDIWDVTRISQLVKLRTLLLKGNKIENIESLETLVNLVTVDLGFNKVNQISSFARLKNLRYVYLSGNRITNIKSLVDNYDSGGLVDGSSIFLTINPLDEESVNDFIPYLRRQGVTVGYCEELRVSVNDYMNRQRGN